MILGWIKGCRTKDAEKSSLWRANDKLYANFRPQLSCCSRANSTLNYLYLDFLPASLVAQTVKVQPAMQETWVWSLGWERSPGGGHGNPRQYSCLEKSPWTEESSGLQSMGSQRVRHGWATKYNSTDYL